MSEPGVIACRALTKTFSEAALKVPVLIVHSLWDQEDMWGAVNTWEALRAKKVTAVEISEAACAQITLDERPPHELCGRSRYRSRSRSGPSCGPGWRRR